MSRHDEDIASDYGDPGFDKDDPWSDDWDEDGHQRYKDDLATGRINEDGSVREPDPPEEWVTEHATHDGPWAHRPGVAARVVLRWRNLTAHPRTLRLGRLEFTIRWTRSCGACAGRGWFYTKGSLNPVIRPEGYDGVSLCGCGSGVTRLVESRRYVRRVSKEAPF